MTHKAMETRAPHTKYLRSHPPLGLGIWLGPSRVIWHPLSCGVQLDSLNSRLSLVLVLMPQQQRQLKVTIYAKVQYLEGACLSLSRWTKRWREAHVLMMSTSHSKVAKDWSINATSMQDRAKDPCRFPWTLPTAPWKSIYWSDFCSNSLVIAALTTSALRCGCSK